MTTQVRELLIAARKLIEQPEHWTKGHYARDARGAPVLPIDSEAVCWCTVGALGRADQERDTNEVYLNTRMVLLEHMQPCLSEFNDNHTHAEVLAAFDKAIAAAS
jgi:hypothetical protein